MAKFRWQLKWQKFVAIAYCWLIRQTLLHSLFSSLVIEYFWRGCFAPPRPGAAAPSPAPVSYTTGSSSTTRDQYIMNCYIVLMLI